MRAIRLALFLSIAFLASCSREEHFPTYKPGDDEPVLVKFAEGIDPYSLEELEIVERLFPYSGEFEARSRDLARWYKVRFKTRTKVPLGIEIEERQLEATVQQADPNIGLQYYLGDRQPWMGIPKVWEEYGCGDGSVIVAVIDGGIDRSHPELKDAVLDEGSHCFVEGLEGDTIYPQDHGTKVAGVIAARGENGIGIRGIAGGNADKPGVKLISCQVFKEDGDKTLSGDIARAIKWAADHGAVICQNSWNYTYNSAEEARSGYTSAAVKEAIDYFNTYAGMDSDGHQRGPMAGGLVLFSAGNDGWQYAHPADYEGVLAIGASYLGGERTTYSNYGSWVDLWAYGGEKSLQLISTAAGGEYGPFYGTSAACPQASGVAALIVSYYGGTGFTRDMLVRRLLEGAYQGKAGSLLSGIGAMEYGCGAPAAQKVEGISASVDKNSILLSWSPSKGAEGYAIEVGDVRTYSKTAGTTVRNLEYGTLYDVRIKAYNVNMAYSEDSGSISVRTPDNVPPRIIGLPENVTEVLSFEKAYFPISLEDPEGEEVAADYIPGSDADTFDGNAIVIDASKAAAGTYTAILCATDEHGGKSTEKFTYTLGEDIDPAFVKEFGNIVLSPGETLSIDIGQHISSPASEIYSYSVKSSSEETTEVSVDSGTISLKAKGCGYSDIELEVRAARKTYTCSFRTLVRNGKGETDLYPNPAVNRIYLRTMGEKTGKLLIFNQNGAKVLERDNVSADAFQPYGIDLGKFEAGIYTLEFCSEKHSFSVL